MGAFLSVKGGEKWKIAGYFGVLSSFLIMSFYSVIAGWGMSYILMSLSGFYEKITLSEIPAVFHKLSSAGAITVFWHFLFTLITMGIVLTGVRKGIEFWSKLMTRVLFLLLCALFLYATTMPGFKEAARFIFSPDFSEFKFSSVLEALGLAFFTLSLGQGIMISYGILAGLTIFPVIFTFHFPPSQGSGLVFKTLPYLFAQLPGALVISTLFFTLFVFTALTSAIPFVEVVATNLMELRGWSRKKAVLLSASATFLLGIPSALAGTSLQGGTWPAIYGKNFLETIDALVSVWMIPIGGLLTTIFIGWKMEKSILTTAFPEGKLWQKGFLVWHFFMKWVIPVTILLIILQKSGLVDFDHLLLKRS
ncbi:MAG: sodium-dependent transporter [Simkania negevensis]|nr:sodium-dependent transporter [Simkania negevensis]